ncbi:MAG: Hsp33 family molecular chaperone HslO [Clostridia bacterium]|nr:Hsp33 family molecular chaperone HslO [Clostridia bacterium]
MNIVLKGIDESGSYRVYLTISTQLVETARKLHNTTPLATAGLGRTLTGAGLMGLLLKNKEDKLTVQFKGEGPAKMILATAYGDGRVKGYIANPDVDLPLREDHHLDVGGSLGIGQLTVIKDLGLKEPYIGKIDLVTGEIADDLTAYYYISEQQNSSVALGVKIDTDLSVKCAGGMIIQMLPDFKEEAVDALEDMLKDLPPLTSLIDELMEDKTLSDKGLIDGLKEKIFGNMPEDYRLKTLDYDEIKWECSCSKENMAKGLMTIGVDDLNEIIEEDGQAELVCQFCESKYHFTKEELIEIKESILRD